MNHHPVVVIRLHVRREEQLVDMAQEFELSELGGAVPVAGDLIVEPGVPERKDRFDPDNRTIYEVVSRYFLPRAHGETVTYVAVVVEERQALATEKSIVCIS